MIYLCRNQTEGIMGLLNKKHSIGKAIAELRKRKGWTQIELAEKLQVSDKAVSKWEKDNGAPSIEFFPILAELFGVSIDYLMTGKETEKEIITISRLELCAKNDDPKILDNISFNSAHITDETGKSLMDYVKQYKSQKVLIALIDSCEHQTHYMNLFPKNEFDLPELLELVKIDRETVVLKNIANNQSLKTMSDFGRDSLWRENRNRQSQASIGYRNIFSYIVTNYNKLTKRQQDDYINLDCNNISTNTCWAYAFPYFIDEAYKCNKQLFEKLLEKVIKNNTIYDEKAELIKNKHRGDSYWTSQELQQLSKENININLLADTVLAAIENEEYDLARKLNLYTATKVEEDVFEQAKIKHNQNLSETEKIVQSCVHYGIININELVATKNLDLIKQGLNHYPIHLVELLYGWLNKKRWKKLFEYAVDNNFNALADNVIKSDTEKIKNELVSIFKKSLTSQGYPVVNNMVFTLRDKRLDDYRIDIEQIIEYLSAYKQQVISDASYELDKVKTISDLTKEYFEAELAKGNSEIVIVKLCVRLEAILRSSYHYDGDFSEMLNKYCCAYGQEDDGWGYNQEAAFVKPLQKLRKCRNSIVHSEKTQENLSLDEIRYCIDYICNMN